MDAPTPEDMARDLEFDLAFLGNDVTPDNALRRIGRAAVRRALAAEGELVSLRELALRVYRDTRTGDPGPGCPAHNLLVVYAWVAPLANKLQADNAALRLALSRLAACAFGPPGELLAAADAARALLGE
jgi:hypothetical protein